MKRKILSLFVLFSLLLCVVTVGVGAEEDRPTAGNSVEREIFLRLDGIEGESSEESHRGAIDVYSFSHGSASEYPSERGIFELFVFTHEIDKATPKIQEYCMNGTEIGRGELDICRYIDEKLQVVYRVILEGIKVISANVYIVDEGDDGFRVMEEVKLEVRKQTWISMPAVADGIAAGFDLGEFEDVVPVPEYVLPEPENNSAHAIILTAVISVLATVSVAELIVIIGLKKKKTDSGK